MKNMTGRAATVTADLHVRGVDADAWLLFRAAAVVRGVPVGELLSTAMRDWVRANPDTPESPRCSGHEKLGLDPRIDDRDGKMRAECPDCHRRIMVTKRGRIVQHRAAPQRYDP
ncbi:MAG TPA: hypothetical protein VGK33_13700 [Chloroflexota bacterium]